MIYREIQFIGPNSLVSFGAGTVFDLDMWWNLKNLQEVNVEIDAAPVRNLRRLRNLIQTKSGDERRLGTTTVKWASGQAVAIAPGASTKFLGPVSFMTDTQGVLTIGHKLTS